MALCLVLLVLQGTGGSAQEPASNVGLSAVGAVGILGGVGQLERSSTGEEGGILVDFGWLRGPQVRLQGELSMLRGRLSESVEVEDTTYTGDWYDLTVGATVLIMGGGPTWRIAPYALASVGVHALSSTFGSPVLDRRYNTNRFGSQFGAGLRTWVGSSGRSGIFVEVRRVIADEVNRTVVRGGYLYYLGDLVRHPAAPP
jgi:hypothetical protein